MRFILVSVWEIEVKMGTYTTNYNLFMPSVGETGWGELVNNNFSTIDTTMKSLSNRIMAVENEVNGNLSCTSVTASGKITGNGGIAGTTGTFSGAVTGASFNGVIIKSSGVINVSSISDGAKIYIPKTHAGYDNAGYVLPYHPNVRYSGSIILCNDSTSNHTLTYFIGDNTAHQASISTTPVTLPFDNVPYLCLAQYGYTIYFRELKFM